MDAASPMRTDCARITTSPVVCPLKVTSAPDKLTSAPPRPSKRHDRAGRAQVSIQARRFGDRDLRARRAGLTADARINQTSAPVNVQRLAHAPGNRHAAAGGPDIGSRARINIHDRASRPDVVRDLRRAPSRRARRPDIPSAVGVDA